MSSSTSRLSFSERIATLKGRAWKAVLRGGEAFAYLVAGFPMALWRQLHFMPPTEDIPPAEYLHRYYAWHYWRFPLAPFRGVLAAVTWPIALVVAIFVVVINVLIDLLYRAIDPRIKLA